MAMPTWGKVLIGCGGLITVLGLGSLVALAWWVSDVPRTWQVETSIEISAPPEDVRALLEDPQRWNEWSAWSRDFDTGVQRSFSGPESGEGATMTWSDRPRVEIHIGFPPGNTSNPDRSKAGRGTVVVGACSESEVRWITTFEDKFVLAGRNVGTVRLDTGRGKWIVPSEFRLEATDDGTRITWSETVDFGGGFAAGVLAVSMGKVMQPMHEDLQQKSLEGLKRVAELR